MQRKLIICILPLAIVWHPCAFVLMVKLFGSLPFPIPFFGGMILLCVPFFAALFAMSTYFESQRRRELQQFAQKHGFRYRTSKPFNIADRYDFELFEYARRVPGGRPRADRCLDGRYQNLPITLFDCNYYFGRGMCELSVLLAKVDFQAPHLIIRPKKIPRPSSGLRTLEEGKSPEKILDPNPSLGRSNYLYFEDAEFHSVFNVRADNDEFAYCVCNSRMREFLLQNRSICWELGGDYLLVHQAKNEWSSPQELESYLRLASDFIARIPEQVLSQDSDSSSLRESK
jgi:hypothetical protein